MEIGKKGQLNLQTVSAFMVIIMILGVIAISIFFVLPTITSSAVIKDKTVSGGSIVNVTLRLDDAGSVPTGITNAGKTTVYENILAINASSNVPVASTNWTVNATGAFFPTAGAFYNGTGETGDGVSINLSLGWDNTFQSDAVMVSDNTTAGTTDFFANVPTVFSILGAVVIILAIILILFAVNKIQRNAGGL